MKFKGFLALILVIGLVLMAGSAKAATSMADNVPGNAAFAYFYATPDCISTTIMIHNNGIADQCIHVVPFDRCSEPGYDYQFCVSEKGTLVLRIDATGDGYGTVTAVTCDGNEIAAKELGIHDTIGTDGTIMGYVFISAIESDATPPGCKAGEICKCDTPDIDDLVATNPLIVCTALIQTDWWVGVNAAMVQGLLDSEVNAEGFVDPDCVTGTDFLPGRACVDMYGRWYDDTSTRGNLVLVFPAGGMCPAAAASCCTECCDESECGIDDGYYITGFSYDEAQTPVSFHKCVEEANMIPFGPGLPTGGATAGWVEIDNVTASAFGFTIMENGVHCDALPLFKEGESAGCPTCVLP